MVIILTTATNKSWAPSTPATVLLPPLLLFSSLLLLYGTSAEKQYTCTYKNEDVTMTCYTNEESYGCCYNNVDLDFVWYKCGVDNCAGEVFYEPPDDGLVRITTAMPTPAGSSGILELSVLLIIVIPVALVGTAVVGISISWCYVGLKRGRNTHRRGSEVRVSTSGANDDVENSLHDSRQDGGLNDSPPEYQTAISIQGSLLTEDEALPPPYVAPSNTTSLLLTPPPPSYASVTGLA